jgi:hypothetical protein
VTTDHTSAILNHLITKPRALSNARTFVDLRPCFKSIYIDINDVATYQMAARTAHRLVSTRQPSEIVNCNTTHVMHPLNIWSPSGTNSMEQLPSSEAIEDIPTLLQTNVHYPVHKAPLLVPVLDTLIHSTPFHLNPSQSILILSSHLRHRPISLLFFSKTLG